MKAGRELDALVAEKIFGMSVELDGEDLVFRIDGGRTVEVFNYSTDIADAWGVVEKLVAAGWVFSFVVDYQHKFQKVVLQTKPRTQNLIDVVVTSETVPHAVCLAALKSVGLA